MNEQNKKTRFEIVKEDVFFSSRVCLVHGTENIKRKQAQVHHG